MRYAYSAAQVRDLEATAMAGLRQDTGRSTDDASDVLMQLASHGLAQAAGRELRRRYGQVYGATVVILVGPGNNGGDALFAGARLAGRGARVVAVRALGQPHPAGLAALTGAGGRVVDLEGFDLLAYAPSPDGVPEVDVVIDGVLGIGGRPGLPAPVAELAHRLVGWGVPIVAVDLPSGVDTDTGAAPADSFAATRTVTFGTYKPCHLLEPARSRVGPLELVDIGLDPSGTPPALSAWDVEDVIARWPFPDERSDKYSRGVVGIETGSEEYPGAAIMNTYGAVHAGAGMVRFLGPDAAAEVIRAQLPNVVFSAGRVQSHLLGSGWGERPDGRDAVERAVSSGLPVLVDADGLRHLPARLPETCLLTPHAGELAGLLGCLRSEVEADPVAAVRAGVERTGATVLLKGATQLVATPGRSTVEVAVPGPSWTAQAGSGDTLAGICAALLAAGVPTSDAALLGASLQALTAAAAPGPLPPHVLVQRSSAVLGELGQRPERLRR